MYVCIYIYIYMCVYIYIYIYVLAAAQQRVPQALDEQGDGLLLDYFAFAING